MGDAGDAKLRARTSSAKVGTINQDNSSGRGRVVARDDELHHIADLQRATRNGQRPVEPSLAGRASNHGGSGEIDLLDRGSGGTAHRPHTFVREEGSRTILGVAVADD